MPEVDYTEGYNIMSHLGKGKALLGMYVDSVATGDVITTPFARCVPVLTPAVAADATTFLNIAQVAGVVTITSGGTDATAYQALIIGDLY